MVEAHSLRSIKKKINSELQGISAGDTRGVSKMIGILFCQPKSPLGKAEIVDGLEYFHVRSGKAVDFFCAGYGAYWSPEYNTDKTAVAKINGVEWLFSPKAFNGLREEIQLETKWKYSGEAELILLTAHKASGKTVKLDFSTAIVCKLEQMTKDNSFTSVRAFFESIFQFADECNDPDAVWKLSDKKGLGLGAKLLKESVLSLIPKQLGETYKSAEHFVIRDISKPVSNADVP